MEEIQGFRVGDCVKIIRKYTGGIDYSKGTVGDTGVVINLGIIAIEVRCDHGTEWWYHSTDIAHDTDINVGDRIRVTGVNINDTTPYVGKVGMVTQLDFPNKDGYPYRVNGIWSSGIKVSPDVINVTNNNTIMKGGEGMERVERDGYVYTKLQSLSPESVLRGGPYKEEFEKYTNEFSFYEDVELGTILDYDDDYPAWLPWLVSHGYVLKEEVRKEIQYDIQRGDRFVIGGFGYMIARVNYDQCCLINLLDGNMKNGGYRVANTPHVSVDEFKGMLGIHASKFESIYATKKRG